jgi:hypothetical protein
MQTTTFMKVLSGLLMMAFLGTVQAQDIIITKDAQKIEAKILEVSGSEIKYKKQSNLEGPTFILGVEELNSIIYANGEVQVFEDKADKQNIGEKDVVAVQDDTVCEKKEFGGQFGDRKVNENTRPFIKEPFFNMYADAEVRYIFDGQIVSIGASTNFTFGCRINDYVYVGGSIGYDFYPIRTVTTDIYVSRSYNYEDAHFITSLSNVRIFIPAKPQLYPFFNISAGCSIIFPFYLEPVHFRLKVGAGVDIKRFTIGMGYDFLSGATYQALLSSTDFLPNHTIYLNLGVRIGRMQ